MHRCKSLLRFLIGYEHTYQNATTSIEVEKIQHNVHVMPTVAPGEIFLPKHTNKPTG